MSTHAVFALGLITGFLITLGLIWLGCALQVSANAGEISDLQREYHITGEGYDDKRG